MSESVTIDEAQAHLKELIHRLAPGDEIIITENQKQVAKLTTESAKKRLPRIAGNCIDMIEIVTDDDQHLEDFKEYM
jgi:antitoxin (DNA-binding transcriptional repressor) of toxin-antitoxin stability system